MFWQACLWKKSTVILITENFFPSEVISPHLWFSQFLFFLEMNIHSLKKLISGMRFFWWGLTFFQCLFRKRKLRRCVFWVRLLKSLELGVSAPYYRKFLTRRHSTATHHCKTSSGEILVVFPYWNISTDAFSSRLTRRVFKKTKKPAISFEWNPRLIQIRFTGKSQDLERFGKSVRRLSACVFITSGKWRIFQRSHKHQHGPTGFFLLDQLILSLILLIKSDSNFYVLWKTGMVHVSH